ALLKDAGPKSPSSLYVCVDQVLFCWLLRRRSRRPLASPMVILLGMSFMEDVPLNWRDEVAADVFIWFSPSWTWSSFQVDKASEPLQDLLWTQHQHIVLQTFWQFGLKVPWFDLPGLSFWSGAKHNPPHSNTRPSLIVLRSAFWRLPAGNVLRSLVRHLFVNEDVHWMESFLGGSLHQSHIAASWTSWEEMAAFTAALYMPHELYQLKFRDMYAMGVPLLAPGSAWLLRSLREMFRMWGQLNSDFRHRLPACPEGVQPPGTPEARCIDVGRRFESDRWPFGEPFLNVDVDPPGKLAYYQTLMDVERYPYVLRFESLAELHEQFQFAHRSGQALGELMRDFFRTKVVANSL
ncbi:unnamed protein product, partial [Polarella glacialis]